MTEHQEVAKPKILIVEDEAIIALDLKSHLEQIGYTVLGQVNSGEKALELIEQAPPDLVLMDIILQGKMDGIEAADIIRSRWGIPVIFLTAYADRDRLERAKLVYPFGYIIKPFQDNDLRVTVEMALYVSRVDIERRKAERALKNSEEKYRLIVENSRDMIFTMSPEGKFLFVSPSVTQLMGYDEATLVGRPFQSIVHPDDVAGCEERMRQHIEKGIKNPEAPYRVKHVSGEWRWHNSNLKAVYDEQGNLAHWQGVARDITESKQDQELLQESEKKYHKLFDFLPIPVYEMDLETNITSANRAIYETFRGSEEDLKKGLKAWQFISPEEIEKTSRNIERLLKGESVEDTEYTLRRLDGSVFPAIVISSAIYRDGKPVGLRGAILDITDRKQAEEGLLKSEEKFRTIFDRTNDGILIADAETKKFLQGNAALCSLLGYTKEEIKNLTVHDIHPSQDLPRVLDQFEKQIKGEIVLAENLPVLRKDGSIFSADISSALTTIGGRDYLIGVFRDITEHKKAEEVLAKTAREWQSTFDATNDAIWILDQDQRVLRSNKTAELFFHRPFGEMIGKHCWEIVHGTEQPIPECPLLRVRKSLHRETMELEMGERWFQVSVDPFLNAADRYSGAVHIISDITERKRTEQALRESREHYRLLVETQTDLISRFTPDGTFVFVNDAYGQFFGKKINELVGKKWHPLPVDQDVSFIEEELQTLSPANPAVIIENRVISGKGNIHWVQFINSGLFDHQGNLVGIQSVGRDLTEHKQLEENLQRSEERYRLLVETVNEAIVVVQDGKAKFVNRGEEWAGYTRKEYMSIPIFETIHPEDRKVVEQRYLQKINGDATPTRHTYKGLDKSGRIHWIEVSSVLIDWEGRPATLNLLTDITERKKADKTLTESEEKFRVIFERSTVGKSLTAPDGKLLQVNKAFADMLGYTIEEIQQINFVKITHPDDVAESRECIRLLLADEQTGYRMEKRYIHKNGDIVWANVSTTLLRDEKRTPLYLITSIVDITEHKRAEEVIKARLRMVTAATTKSYEELMQIALDEIEAQTGSSIGFYHFILHDQETIALQTWSTNTIKTMCTAEGQYRHYPISQAGVWADCIRRRGPVIHNDYASLPQRQGTPEGHAQVVRELTFPIIRDDRIVAVMGVGNKKTAYNETDVEMALLLGDFSWEIVERRRAEATLLENEDRYRDLVENIQDLICTHDLEGHILSANQAAAKLLEMDLDQLLQMNIRDILSSEVRDQFNDYMESLKREGQAQGLLKIQTASGKKRIWEFHNTVRTKGVDKPIVRGLARDITDRLWAEKALKESEKRFRRIYEESPIGYQSLDTEARILDVNPSWLALLGYTREEVIGKRIDHFFTPESKAAFVERFPHFLDKGFSYGSEYQMRRKDGFVLTILFDGVFVKDESGAPQLTHCTLYNITDRKQAEKALRLSEEKLSKAFRASPDWMTISTLEEGRYIDVNDAFVELSGFSREEALGKTAVELGIWVDPQERNRALEIIKKDGVLKNFEAQVRLKSGEVRTILWSVETFKLENRTYAIATYHDITERREAQEKLGQTMENLRRALGGTIEALAMTSETRDPYTSGHQRRVADLARTIAQELGLSEERVNGLRMAASIHDLGKISIPAEILSKPTKLSDIEFSLIKMHSQIGYDVLKNIDFPWPIARIIVEHHERMNGSGYPNGLTGDQLLLETKILTVADVVEAIATHRPYRPALGIEAALEEIEKNKGLLYDPEVVDVCLRLFREKGYQLEKG